MFPDIQKNENLYKARGYSEAEVEILLELGRLRSEVEQLLKDANKYVRREEFEPIQRLVYGMVGVILLAFVAALVALVMTR